MHYMRGGKVRGQGGGWMLKLAGATETKRGMAVGGEGVVCGRDL